MPASLLSDDCWDAFRLRRDAVYLQTDAGMLFRGPRSTFALKGRNIYAVFQRLLPHLDGTRRLDTWLRQAPDASREALMRLLVRLRDGGVIERLDVDDARLADPVLARRFAPQIEFIAHCESRPTARFLEFRDSNVLLCGGGVAFQSAGLALLRNGLRTLRVACAPEEDLSAMVDAATRSRIQGIDSRVERHEAGDPPCAMTLYCAENPDLAEIHRLNRSAIETGRAFLPAHGHDGHTQIGPMVVPGAAGCWDCAMLRWADQAPGHAASDTWRRLALGQQAAGAPATAEIPARILGNNAALEVFKYFVLRQSVESAGRLLLQDAASLGSELKAVLPHPDCTACRFAPPSERVAELAAETPLLAAWQPYIDTRYGVFRNFDDDSLEQLPLRLTRLRLSPAAGWRRGATDAAVTAWSLRDSDAARGAALRRAIALAAADDPPWHLIRASVAAADATGAPQLRAAALWGWQGNGGEMPASHRYLCATDGRGAPAWLPAGAVHRHLDRNACFDPHGAGVGCGATTADAIDAALLSLAAHRSIAGLADGSLAPRRLAWRGRGGKDIAYLASAAEQLGRPDLHIGLLAPLPGLFAAVECGADARRIDADALQVGTGFSAASAVADLLGWVVAAAQLQRQGVPLRTLPTTGRHAGAELCIACDGGAGTSLDLDDDAGSAARAPRPTSPWWWIDITPPDVALTRTLRVVKVVWGSEAAGATAPPGTAASAAPSQQLGTDSP